MPVWRYKSDSRNYTVFIVARPSRSNISPSEQAAHIDSGQLSFSCSRHHFLSYSRIRAFLSTVCVFRKDLDYHTLHRPSAYSIISPKFMRTLRRSSQGSSRAVLDLMAAANSAPDTTSAATTWQQAWQQRLRWIPTSKEAIIASERRLLTLVKTPFFQEQVNIGSGPPGSGIRWFRSASTESRYINTVTFDNKLEDAPTLVMVHGYGASQGFFFRNFDALAKHFRVIAIDQLGWGASSRPDFSCKSTEETEAWFIDSFEAWRKAKNLENFILLGHSFGGYVAAKYALKHPGHVQHLILVGSVGFSAQSDERNEWLMKFRSTWRGAILNHLWESNFTPQRVVRGIGRWGPDLVKRYTSARFGSRSVGTMLDEEESRLLSDYVYHSLAGKASGELCLKYIFSFGALARSPLLASAADWKVPTSFIYGMFDWMDYKGAVDACANIPVQKEIIRVPQSGHFVFLDNANGFHDAVLYSCRRFLKIQNAEELLDGLTKAL